MNNHQTITITIAKTIIIIPCLWTSLLGLVNRYIPHIIPIIGKNIEPIYPITIAAVCLSGFNGLPHLVHATFPNGTGEPHLGQGVTILLFCWVFVVSPPSVSEAPHPEQNLVPSFTSLPQLLQNGILFTLQSGLLFPHIQGKIYVLQLIQYHNYYT